MDYQLPPSADLWVTWEGYIYPTACIDFELVEWIVAEEKEICLLNYAARYKALTALPRYSASQVPSLLNLTERGNKKQEDARQFLIGLNTLQQKYPFTALRLMIILLCIHAHAPKFSTDDLSFLFNKYLHDERLDKTERLEFIAQCTKKAANAFNNDQIRLSLTPLFVETARENPALAVQLFEDSAKCIKLPKIYGLVVGENFFLEFALLVKKERPEYYIQALLNVLAADLERSDISIDEAKNAAKELYQILMSPDSPYHIAPELICQRLILQAQISEHWYPELPRILLEIEKNKSSSDNASKRNCFMIALNCQGDEQLISEALHLYQKFVRGYHQYALELEYADRVFDSPYEHYKRGKYQAPLLRPFVHNFFIPIQYINHVTEIYEFVIYALSSGLRAHAVRNKQHLVPEYCPLVEDSLCAYWEIVEFLSVNNKRVCLYVLESVLSDSSLQSDERISSKDGNISAYYQSKEIGHLAEQAVQRLIKEFLVFSEFSFDDAIKFFHHMVINSVINRYDRWSNKTKPIDRVLDAVYPIIEAKAPELALKAVQDALAVENPHGHGATAVWKPANWQGK